MGTPMGIDKSVLKSAGHPYKTLFLKKMQKIRNQFTKKAFVFKVTPSEM